MRSLRLMRSTSGRHSQTLSDLGHRSRIQPPNPETSAISGCYDAATIRTTRQTTVDWGRQMLPREDSWTITSEMVGKPRIPKPLLSLLIVFVFSSSSSSSTSSDSHHSGSWLSGFQDT